MMIEIVCFATMIHAAAVGHNYVVDDRRPAITGVVGDLTAQLSVLREGDFHLRATQDGVLIGGRREYDLLYYPSPFGAGAGQFSLRNHEVQIDGLCHRAPSQAL